MQQRQMQTSQAKQQKVVDFLRKESGRLGSTVLASLTLKVSGDPFAKVKKLIQELVERLIAEATAEATKKGFCDTELAKANKDKEFRWNSVKKLNTELQALEVKDEELTQELVDLRQEVSDLSTALNTTEDTRNAERDENLQTLKDARVGLTAVSGAVQILKVFYKQAGKASFVQASPVDEDAPEVAKGAYKGNQESSKAILGLLQVIQSDFQRTITKTEEAENKAQAEFVDFERTSKSDIGSKEMKIELDVEDLAVAKASSAKDTQDMQDNMEMLDAALKELEELKPMCIDSGMSYEDRVQKRQDEIAALRQALCMLDPDGVEAECI